MLPDQYAFRRPTPPGHPWAVEDPDGKWFLVTELYGKPGEFISQSHSGMPKRVLRKLFHSPSPAIGNKCGSYEIVGDFAAVGCIYTVALLPDDFRRQVQDELIEGAIDRINVVDGVLTFNTAGIDQMSNTREFTGIEVQPVGHVIVQTNRKIALFLDDDANIEDVKQAWARFAPENYDHSWAES